MPAITANTPKRPTNQQRQLVELVYKFRFVTSQLVSEYYGRHSKSVIHRRLQLLTENGILGMHYDGHMRLRGEPASYYLLPSGIAALRAHSDPELVSRRTLKAAHQDATASWAYINHCLSVFRTYNRFKARYGNALSFSTRSNMTFTDFDYFPKQLPDGFIRYNQPGKTPCYFLEYVDASLLPIGQYKLVKKYAKYFESKAWDYHRSDQVAILFMCQTASVHKAMTKLVAASSMDAGRVSVMLQDNLVSL